MEINNSVIKWKWLKSQISLIRDNTLRKVIFAELRKRAFKDWGFDPETTKINQKQEVKLDNWEKEFVEDIEKTIAYEIDIRKDKRKATEKEAHIRMADFIEKGGKFTDLPEDLQNKHTAKLYMDVMFEKIKNCEDFLQNN